MTLQRLTLVIATIATLSLSAAAQAQTSGPQGAGLANNPDLIYDPSNGNVKIDADGSNVLVFNWQSAAQFNSPANFSDLDTDVGFISAFVDNTSSAIGWTSALALANIGFDGPAGGVNTPLADLGNIFPTGLNQAGLQSLLTNNEWGGPSAGGGNFDLVTIPEPSSIVLAGLGLVGLAGFVLRRRKK